MALLALFALSPPKLTILTILTELFFQNLFSGHHQILAVLYTMYIIPIMQNVSYSLEITYIFLNYYRW